MNISKQIYIARLKSHPVECLAEVYKEKADVLKQTGVYDQAMISFDKAKDLFGKLNNKCKCGGIDHAIGDLLVTKGAFQEAEGYFNTALNIYIECKQDSNIAKCYKELGKVHQYRENPDAALSFYNKAMDLYKQCGDDQGQHIVMEYLADNYRSKSEYSKALELLSELEKVYEKSNEIETLCRIDKLAGSVYMDQRNYEKANIFFNKAYQGTKKTGEKSMAMYILCDLGAASFFQEDFQTACIHFEECLALAEKLDSIYMKAVNLVNVADSLLRMGNIERSKGYISQAATINHNIGGLNSEIERIQKEIAEKEGDKKETY